MNQPITDALSHRVGHLNAAGRAGSAGRVSEPVRRIKTRRRRDVGAGKGIVDFRAGGDSFDPSTLPQQPDSPPA